MSTTVLAFDYGAKRTGVAVGQTLTKTANELNTLPMVDKLPEKSALKRVLNEWQPGIAVIGMPASSGKAFAKRIRAFQRLLSEEFQLESVLVDETLTTEQANFELHSTHTKMKRKTDHRDQIAARLILETYFETIS